MRRAETRTVTAVSDRTTLVGETAAPCARNPLQRGRRPAPGGRCVVRRRSGTMRGGPPAMGGREPCQVGNQAALSSPPCVPQGCRFGAGCPGNGCSIHSEKGVQSCHASCRKNSGLIWARSFLYSSRFIRGSGCLYPPAESSTFYLKISENSQHLRGRQRHRPIQTATQLHSCQSGGPVPITNCV